MEAHTLETPSSLSGRGTKFPLLDGLSSQSQHLLAGVSADAPELSRAGFSPVLIRFLPALSWKIMQLPAPTEAQ